MNPIQFVTVVSNLFRTDPNPTIPAKVRSTEFLSRYSFLSKDSSRSTSFPLYFIGYVGRYAPFGTGPPESLGIEPEILVDEQPVGRESRIFEGRRSLPRAPLYRTGRYGFPTLARTWPMEVLTYRRDKGYWWSSFSCVLGTPFVHSCPGSGMAPIKITAGKINLRPVVRQRSYPAFPPGTGLALLEVMVEHGLVVQGFPTEEFLHGQHVPLYPSLELIETALKISAMGALMEGPWNCLGRYV